MALSEILGFKKRVHVGVAVSANNTLELVYVDKGMKCVTRYASGEVRYNSAIREIIDYEEFTHTLMSLFDEAGLDPQECSVTLSIPSVSFGITSTENDSDQAYIIDNLQTELEDLYIFKRNEPILSYDYVPSPISKSTKNIAYAAAQGKVIMTLIGIFDKLGVELERIDNSYVSLLRGLRYCDKFASVLAPEVKTAVLIIGANSFSSLIVSGDAIIECNESPLAVKSYSSEEIYSIVSKYATDALEQNSPDAMILISETDDINTQLLTEKIEFTGDIECVNKSAGEDEEFIEYSELDIDSESSMISNLSLEAVGAGVSVSDEYLGSINFLPGDRISKNLIEVGPYEVEWFRFLILVLVIALLAGALLGGLLYFIFSSRAEDSRAVNVANTKEIKLKEDSIKQKGKNSSQHEILPVVQQTLANNEFIYNMYSALSAEIPENMYIRKFVSDNKGGLGVIGESRTSEAVESFVNKLKDKNTNLMVSRLSVNSTSDQYCRIPNGFSFTIKTASVDIDLEDNVQGVRDTLRGMTNNMNTILPDGTSRPLPYDQTVPVPQPLNSLPSGNNSMSPPPPPVI